MKVRSLKRRARWLRLNRGLYDLWFKASPQVLKEMLKNLKRNQAYHEETIRLLTENNPFHRYNHSDVLQLRARTVDSAKLSLAQIDTQRKRLQRLLAANYQENWGYESPGSSQTLPLTPVGSAQGTKD